MIILQITVLILSLLAVPILIGLLPLGLNKTSSCSISSALIWGYVITFAAVEVVGIPIVLLMDYSGYHVFAITFGTVLLLLALAGFLLGRKKIKRPCLILSFKSLSREAKIYIFILILCIGFQLVMGFVLSSMDADDFYYNAQALQAQQYDVLYRIDVNTGRSSALDIRHALALFPIYQAFLSSISGIHVVILAHKIMPLVLIPLSYLLIFKIARKLFPQRIELQLIFTILINFWRVFGHVSYFTTETFFLLRTWQGKSVAGNLIIPAIFYIFILMYENEDKIPKYLYALLTTLVLASGASSSLAVMLSCGLIGLLASIFLIIKHNFRRFFGQLLCCVPGMIYIVLYILN